MMRVSVRKAAWVALLSTAMATPAVVAIAQDAVNPPAGIVPNAASDSQAIPSGPKTCSRSLLTSYDPNKREFVDHDVPVWDVENGSAILFKSGMTIDADGAPNAYNPDNT